MARSTSVIDGKSSLSPDFCIHIASVETQTPRSDVTCLRVNPLVSAMRNASCQNFLYISLPLSAFATQLLVVQHMIIFLDGYYSIQRHGIKPWQVQFGDESQVVNKTLQPQLSYKL